MCGIAGYLKVPGEQSPAESTLVRMTDSLSHRGPDGFGYYHDDHASLGHRRLSIVDLAGGAQPMYGASGSTVIVYNGEIYNHASLRSDLEEAGHHYCTRCDTETILHSYEEYGTRCVERFRGMFAFAIWDSRQKRLFAARDRLGIKPFYYWFDGREFVFGSEVKALLHHPRVSAEANESALAEYLGFGYLNPETTLFKNISQLRPGHTLALQRSGDRWSISQEPYWDIPTASHCAGTDVERDLRDRCLTLVNRSVCERLMSDVPLGMFLSGGVDSSAIAALMKRARDEPVETFSVGYRETAFSELGFARDVADHIGSEHHEVELGREQFFGALPRLTYHEDEPITWPSSIPLYFVSRLAAARVKVVLTGEGSDELFAGYARYRNYLLDAKLSALLGSVPESWRSFVRQRITSTSLLNADWRRKLGHTVLGRELGIESLYLDNYYCSFTDSEARLLLRTPTGAQGNIYESYLSQWNRQQPTLLSRLLYADQRGYLLELLRKQDRMSMAASIESRVPLLDHDLVEFATTVPDELKIRRKEGKYIFKRSVEGLLPQKLIYRKKMGFPTPISIWLRDSRAQSQLANLQAPEGLLASLLDRQALRRTIDDHVSGRIDGTDRLWRLLTLQTWGDVFLLGKYGPSGPQPLG